MKNFEHLSEMIPVLDRSEQALIKGGDLVSDFLNQIMVRDSNVSDSMYNAFVSGLTDLASTSVGRDMLTSLLNCGTQIHLNGKMPDSPGAGGQYNTGAHVFLFGNFTDDPGSNSAAVTNFDTIAHEFYHAYTDIIQGQSSAYYHDVRSELDAMMFERMADIQFDTDHNLTWNSDNSHVRMGIDASAHNSLEDPAANTAFAAAWQDIFANHNFTLDNYNTLIANFAKGSSYTLVTPHTANQVSDISILDINNVFFQRDFGNYKLTPPDDGSSSSGGGGGGGSDTSAGGIDSSSYWQYQQGALDGIGSDYNTPSTDGNYQYQITDPNAPGFYDPTSGGDNGGTQYDSNGNNMATYWGVYS